MSRRARELMSSGPDSEPMAASVPPDVVARLAQIERELRDLHLRVIALERMLGAGELHPQDQSTVQKKVTYDWQT